MQITEEEYFETRVNDQISWYERKSSRHKQWYYFFKVLEVSLALLVSLLTGYITHAKDDLKLVVSLIGVVVAAISGLIPLFKFQENWIQYRTTVELLKNEKYLYLTKAGMYKKARSFSYFVERFESYISKENSHWASYIKPQEDDEA